jgi:pyridoxine kinase
MNVLSIQSEVVYGHVGNSAARFALSRQGHEVWAVPTVLLSSHAGYAKVEGEAVSADLIRRLVNGLAANGWLAQCAAVLSGYLGGAAQADAVADAVSQAKAAGALYCLDPVFGDDGRVYAKDGVEQAIARKLLPLADIVTPNAFELSRLAGQPVTHVEDALGAARTLARPLIVATSIAAPGDRIGALAVTNGEAWFASTPRLASVPRGAGDLFAALFLGSRLSGRSVPESLQHATAAVFHVLAASVAHASDEMLLIAEQDALVAPPPHADFRLARVE